MNKYDQGRKWRMEALYIAESKRRCAAYGLKQDAVPIPNSRLSVLKLNKKQDTYSEVISVMNLLGKKTSELLQDIPILISLCDENGYLLSFFGNEMIKQTISNLGIELGIQMNEDAMGTNVIALALEQKKPIELLGKNHYHEMLHSAACYSVPFHFANGLAGAVTIFTAIEFHGPYALPLLSNMVDSMDREMILKGEARRRDLLHRVTINTTNDGVLITDKKGLIIEINQLIEKATHCKKQDMMNTSVFMFDPFANYMDAVLNREQQFENIECSFLPATGERMICLLDAFSILDDKAEIIGAYLRIKDISERIECEKQMITTEKFSLIGKLAAGIAHEIRNPLTSIMGFVQLLKEKYQTSDTYFRYMDIVYDELISLNRIVSDFVLMAKPSKIKKREVVLQNVINEIVQIMISQANLKNVILNTCLGPNEIKLFIDADQMKQVFMNLLQNAFEATSEGGEVSIILSIDHKKTEVEIDIQDTGIGMTESQMKEIFNPFFTTKQNGIGLGLAICYKIVENHDGVIKVISNQGSGTKFTIVLPILLKV
jgi:two-component system, sporulation sensor kinase E